MMHPKEGENFKYVCEVCSQKFDNKNHFQQHIDRHKEQKRYQCATCNYYCYSISQLNIHLHSCIDGIKYECRECGMMFIQKQCLKNHFEKIHVDADNCVLYCDKSIKLYKYKNAFTKHMKREHNYIVS